MSFRLVNFVVSMGNPQVEMPVHLKFRREHWASTNTALGFVSIYREVAPGCENE